MSDEFEIIEDEEGIEGAVLEKVRKLKAALKEAENEKKEYLEGWQRAKADLINHKRDEEKRIERLRTYSEDALIHDFLPILDSLDMALSDSNQKHLSDEAVKGMQMIRGQYLEILKRYGVEPISAENTPFNPEVHEALGSEPSDKPEGTVIQELKRGYARNGRVVRPAMVKTAAPHNE